MLQQILFAAVAVRTILEAVVAPIYDNVPALEPYKWTQQYWAYGVGVLGAWVYQLDIFSTVGLELSTFGIVLTGLVFGGGAELWHAILERFNAG